MRTSQNCWTLNVPGVLPRTCPASPNIPNLKQRQTAGKGQTWHIMTYHDISPEHVLERVLEAWKLGSWTSTDTDVQCQAPGVRAQRRAAAELSVTMPTEMSGQASPGGQPQAILITSSMEWSDQNVGSSKPNQNLLIWISAKKFRRNSMWMDSFILLWYFLTIRYHKHVLSIASNCCVFAPSHPHWLEGPGHRSVVLSDICRTSQKRYTRGYSAMLCYVCILKFQLISSF